MALWKVFKHGEKELCAYTLAETFPGEEQSTKELLSYENGCAVENISVTVEERKNNPKKRKAKSDEKEVRKVIHGRWIEQWPPKNMILTGDKVLFVCSVCTAKYADVEGFRYCPHCGQPMDL